MDGTAVFDDIRQRYFPEEQSNQLSALLLVIPLDFLKDVFGKPMSLCEIFSQYRAERASFTPQIMDRLPKLIKDALKKIEAKEIKLNAQEAAFQKLELPEEFVGQGFIELPEQQGTGMAAYWAFLEMSDALAEIGIKQILKEYSAEVTEGITQEVKERLESSRDHPMRGYYYAQANKISGAHAIQGGNVYAWNLLELREIMWPFTLFLKRQIGREEFLDRAFERIIEILSHELVHIIEETQEGTHNDVFYERQKLLLSAFIGAKDQVAAQLDRIAGSQQYFDNTQEVSVKDFLAYIAAQKIPPAPSLGEPISGEKADSIPQAAPSKDQEGMVGPTAALAPEQPFVSPASQTPPAAAADAGAGDLESRETLFGSESVDATATSIASNRFIKPNTDRVEEAFDAIEKQGHEVNEAELGLIIAEVVHETMFSLNKSRDMLGGSCEIAAKDIEKRASSFFGTTATIKVYRFAKSANVINLHTMVVVTTKTGKEYVLDPTLAQFFGSDDEIILDPLGIAMHLAEKSADISFVDNLLRQGYVEFSNKILGVYEKTFGGFEGNPGGF